METYRVKVISERDLYEATRTKKERTNMNLLFWACVLTTFKVSMSATTGHLASMDGQLVRIIDDCNPNDPNSCGPRKCCVKEGLGYIPEETGPKPAYQIMCKTLGQTADLCFTMPTTEICPCDTGLSCHVSFGSLGHCR